MLIYQKNLSLEEFDETIFLNEKNISSTPFTPFSKQGVKMQIKNHFNAAYNHKKEKNTQGNQNLNCKRVLNYESKIEDEKNTIQTNQSIPQLVKFELFYIIMIK